MMIEYLEYFVGFSIVLWGIMMIQGFLWLAFDCYVIAPIDNGMVFVYYDRKYGECGEIEELMIDGRRTLVGIQGRLGKSVAAQVNPKCHDRKAFDVACWNMYGTGRRDYD